MSRTRVFVTLLGLVLVFALALTACGSAQTEDMADVSPTQSIENESEDEHVEEVGEDQSDAEADHDEEAGEADDHEDSEADHDDSAADHDDSEGDHTHVEAPHEYEDLVNPVDGDSEAIAAGEALFLASCATCHGETGMGDGPAAAGLDPKPAPLADADMLAELTDGYLYWRIEQGGAMEPFNSAMPAWGEAFGEDQIWQLVAFLRSLASQ